MKAFTYLARLLGWKTVEVQRDNHVSVALNELEKIEDGGTTLETKVAALTTQLSDATARNTELETQHTAIAAENVVLKERIANLETQVRNLLNAPAEESASTIKGTQSNSEPDPYANARTMIANYLKK